MTFPLQAFQAVSSANPWTYIVFGLIGFGFGFALEMSGFGNSKKLAAQFYFKDLTVLKVMFTAIVVAMVLIFASAGLGILNFGQVWVNPTYLASGIVGGLIMGVGFIVGGFCPGTSVAASATGKIDGMFYLAGGFFGAFLFGETVTYFEDWYNTAGYYGRLTIDQVLNLPVGVVVTLLVLMALFMFWGGEQLERIFGKKDLSKEPKLRIAGAAGLVALAVGVIFIGTPSINEKYSSLTITRTHYRETGEEKDGVKVLESFPVAFSPDQALASREIQITPAELYSAVHDQTIDPLLLDVRQEYEYNLFHIEGAEHLPLTDLNSTISNLLAHPAANHVVVLMSNDEKTATDAWKIMTAEGVPNVYILEGGINNWIAYFGEQDPDILPLSGVKSDDQLGYAFPSALGDRYLASDPDPIKYEELEFVPKIQLQIKRDKSGGGCG